MPTKLYTEVTLPSYDYQITTTARGLVVGSCFATAIGDRLTMGDLPVTVNAQGVLYNPLSIAQGVQMVRHGCSLTSDDLELRDGLWHSFSHHGSFSAPTPEEVISKTAFAPIEKFDYIILTLGSAFVYERSGQVVANCHKFPESHFTRRRVSVSEVTQALKVVRSCYPDSYILLTVSPIRHLRDGLSANSISKATLRVACEEFCATDLCSGYFPSYEIVMDELRDYRFYAADMLHPSPLAVDLVFEKFSSALLSADARSMVVDGERRARAAAHRPQPLRAVPSI